MTHEELRSELEKSESQAQRKLFDQYCSYVYTIVYSRLRSCCTREDIEECVSDVFADIFSSYRTDGDFSGEVSGFVGTIARRKSADVYKKHISDRITMPIDDEAAQHIAAETDIEEDHAAKELRKEILNMIDSLGEPDSVIIMQKYYFGRSSKEISEIVSLSPAAVRVRCGRAVKRLRKTAEQSGLKL